MYSVRPLCAKVTKSLFQFFNNNIVNVSVQWVYNGKCYKVANIGTMTGKKLCYGANSGTKKDQLHLQKKLM